MDTPLIEAPSEMSAPAANRVQLSGLSPRAYEHPADRAALVALRSVPGFDWVLRKLFGLIRERGLRLLFLGSAVRVNERQFRGLNRTFQECLEVLDMPERPELYVAQTPLVNAGAVGWERPFIVLNSGTLALLEEDELRVILGHELGHILSGHVLYKTMLRVLVDFSILTASVPLGYLGLQALIAALSEWDRKSELSADRAGLLATQDPAASFRLQMKLAGGARVEDMDMDEFVLQAEEYEAGGDVLDSIFKVLNLAARSHPFPVLRVAELKRWMDRGEYARILSGEYPRRAEDPQASILDELKASARSYKDDYEDSRDPLTQFFKDLGGNLASAGSRFRDRFGRRE